jgi:D-alanyl-D-alanine carboxypeptidase/D-alanyl-D-alanine-endopeptidase (penicillin-binding protein 4)
VRHGIRMRRRRGVCALAALVLLLLLDSSAVAGDAPVTGGRPALEGLDWVVDSMLAKPELRGTDIAILIESLDTGEVLYERNPDVPMIPASNMKLITGAAALARLGPDYQYGTVFSTNAPAIEPVLRGDVFVRGSGDPAIVSEELWNIAERLRTLGIDRIEGDLVFDTSYFDREWTTSEDVAGGDRAYHARTGALSANFNTVRVDVLPGEKRGDPARVIISPDVRFVIVENHATTCAAGRGETIEVRRESVPAGGPRDSVEWPTVRNVITVNGRIPEGGEGKTAYRSLDDPLWHFASSLEAFIVGAGVGFKGGLRPGKAPADARELFVHESKPLSLIVRDMGKYSNNFVAEQLAKTLGAEATGAPGTTAAGCDVLVAHIASVGGDTTGVRIVDGCGFSRANRVTTRSIAAVIRAAARDFSIFPEFLASLSVSGTDGTLSDRMGYGGLEGAVRAKTGLLDGVTAISGIMECASGRRVVFSIITNGSSCEAWKAHDAEHAILTHAHQNL